MAKGSDKKLYIALGVLAALGGALYFQQQQKEKAVAEHSYEAINQDLPKLEFAEENVGKIDKIVIDKPATDGSKKPEGEQPAEKIVLSKDGETWKMKEPALYRANQKNVESLLENLPKLQVKERIAKGTNSYESYDLTDEKALHVTLFAGDDKTGELWIGKGGGRGQMVRVAGHDGVYTLDGYSAFLYSRDSASWRDKSIMELDPEEVATVRIDNEEGSFVFEREQEKKKADDVEEGAEESSWTGQFKAEKSPVAKSIEDFAPSKVDDLLRAYKKLNASNFGDEMSPEQAGLAEPLATLTFVTKGGQEKSLVFGSDAEGGARWVKLPEEPQIYSVGSWAAGWAMAGPDKFQKKEGEEEAPSAPPGMGMGGPPGGMPPGMGGPPGGMPPGHP